MQLITELRGQDTLHNSVLSYQLTRFFHIRRHCVFVRLEEVVGSEVLRDHSENISMTRSTVIYWLTFNMKTTSTTQRSATPTMPNTIPANENVIFVSTRSRGTTSTSSLCTLPEEAGTWTNVGCAVVDDRDDVLSGVDDSVGNELLSFDAWWTTATVVRYGIVFSGGCVVCDLIEGSCRGRWVGGAASSSSSTSSFGCTLTWTWHYFSLSLNKRTELKTAFSWAQK